MSNIQLKSNPRLEPGQLVRPFRTALETAKSASVWGKSLWFNYHSTPRPSLSYSDWHVRECALNMTAAAGKAVQKLTNRFVARSEYEMLDNGGELLIARVSLTRRSSWRVAR